MFADNKFLESRCILLNLIAATAIEYNTNDGKPHWGGSALLIPLLALGQLAGAVAMLVGTAIGMLPRTALAAGLAAAANAEGTRGLGDVVRERGPWVTVAGIAVLVIAFVIIARVGRAALQRVVPASSPDAS